MERKMSQVVTVAGAEDCKASEQDQPREYRAAEMVAVGTAVELVQGGFGARYDTRGRNFS
jgi:hypothetical protein